MSEQKRYAYDWSFKKNAGAGIQIYGHVPFDVDAVEYSAKQGWCWPLYEIRMPSPFIFNQQEKPDKNGDWYGGWKKVSEILAYETFVQFAPQEWKDMQLNNAKLITTAINECEKINPQNPQVIAENINEMHETLTQNQTSLEEILALIAEARKNKEALDDLQSEVEGIMNQNEKLLEKLNEVK